MSDPGGSTPERRQRRRNEEPPDPAAAAISVAKVFGNRDLLGEILLRVDSPTWLVRAAVASKCCIRVASDPAFLDSFRARHPPRILGLSVIGIRSSPRLLPFPQPPELAAAARFASRALGYLGRDDRCSDYCNGRLLVEMTGNRDWLRYDMSSLYHVGRHRILPPPPPLGSGDDEEPGLFYSHRLFLFEDDATSCLSLSMACDTETVRANFSILRDGVWGFQQSAVRELQQDPYQTVLGHKLLSGGKVYMMTTAGCILALDLVTATFSALELPDGAKRSASFRLSRAQQSGFYLIYTTGLLLRVWHCNGAGQWVLVDAISVYKACANLSVQKWVPDDEYTSPVCIVGVGDNAEFVILELVASGIVCCMQRRNRVVEKVAEGLMQICGPSARPITMVWPPFLPVPKEDADL